MVIKKANFLSKQPRRSIKYEQLIYYLALVLIVIMNLGISMYIRDTSKFFVANPNPIGFIFGYYSSVAILVLTFFAVYRLKILENYPVFTLLIFSGLTSNFVEKILWQNVADYLRIFNWYLNLADIQLLLGVFFVNLQIWLPGKTASIKEIFRNNLAS